MILLAESSTCEQVYRLNPEPGQVNSGTDNGGRISGIGKKWEGGSVLRLPPSALRLFIWNNSGYIPVFSFHARLPNIIGVLMAGVFEVYVKSHFSAAHRLVGYPGDCARVHGHNWIIEVFVRCTELDGLGIAIDFRDIKAAVKAVLSNLDHSDLNDLDEFRGTNPTSENIARFLYRELSQQLNAPQIRISKVKVSETPGAGAFYWEE